MNLTRLLLPVLLLFASAAQAKDVSLLSADGGRIEVSREISLQEPVLPVAQAGPSYPEITLCACKPCIDYVSHRSMKRFNCSKTMEMVLLVKHPCKCCYVEVPICMPVCCEGEPKTWCKSALLGREMVVYQWCCGFRAVVLFKPNGDITVHYHGN